MNLRKASWIPALLLFAAFGGLLLVMTYRDPADVAYQRGVKLAAAGDTEGAIAVLDQAIRLRPDFADAYYKRSEIYFALKELDAGLADYRQGFALAPKDAPDVNTFTPAFIARAVEEYNNDEYEKAILDFGIGVEFAPTPANVNNLATAYHISGDFESSLRELTRAIEMNEIAPDATKMSFALLYFNRGFSHGGLGQLDLAMTDFERSNEYEVNQDASMGIANVYLGLDDYEQAIQAAQHVLEMPPKTYLSPNRVLVSAYDILTKAYAELGNYEKVIESATSGIALNPDPGDYLENFYLHRGDAYAILNQPEQAIADYNQYIALKPEDGIGYRARGDVYKILNQLEQAITDYNQSILLNPDSARAYFKRAVVHKLLESDPPTSEEMALTAADYWQWLTHMETTRTDETPIQPGDSVKVAMHEGQVYAIPFTLSADETINIYAREAKGTKQVDPLIVILESTGNAIVSDDDSGGEWDSAIENFSGAGSYTLMVGHAGGGSEGEITVTMELANTSGE
jgi:tetratricopeptide (TPR) repeat protein